MTCNRHFAQNMPDHLSDLRKIVVISPKGNICARYAQDCSYFLNAQDLHKIVLLSPMCNICARFAQDCASFSNVCNICTRFAQDCSHFSNAQYMRNICAKLYFFLQCAIYAQGLHKIVLLSPLHNICTRFAQDVLLSSMRVFIIYNVQYMRKICARL